MAYNTKAIEVDVNQKPIPQIYNPVTDEYEVLQGANGAARHIIYGADGNPISTDDNNKLAVRAAEIETLLELIEGKDFATEAKQDALIAKDFATQTTLAAVLAKLSEDPATQTTLTEILEKIIPNPATEAKQDALIAKDFATQTTLAAILTQLNTTGIKKIIDALPSGGNFIGKVGVDSNIESVTAAPVVGTKTVTATAAEIFAGAVVKANRRKLIIRNEDPALRLRIGPSSVTQQNGYPIEPGGTIEIQFDPATPVAIYAISEGAALSVAVVEV